MGNDSLGVIFANIGVFTTVVGVLVIIVIAGILWAKKTISDALGKDFVTQDQHKEKEDEILEKINKLVKEKYTALETQIARNHEVTGKEITKLQEQYDKNNDMLIRIDEKVGLLVANKIKKD